MIYTKDLIKFLSCKDLIPQKVACQLVHIEIERGSSQHPGILIELFNQIYEQSKQPYQINSKIFISFYSTQKQRNCYLDLLLGQRYQFFTKKNFDNYHTFYHKQIQSFRQFLIALKIATTRFQQCCSKVDSFVFKLILSNFDQFTNQQKNSQLEIVYSDNTKKIFQNFCKRIYNFTQNFEFKSQDGGDLINYLEPSIKSSKILLLYSMHNKKSQLQDSLPIFDILTKLHQRQIKLNKISQEKFEPIAFKKAIDQLLQNQRVMNKEKNIILVNSKQLSQLKQLKYKYYEFSNQNNIKFKNYIEILEKDSQTRQETYQKVRFPVSLEIKQESNIKGYYIAKIYGLSENYRMEDMNSKYDKLMVIKNQILISIKAVLKQLKNENLSDEINKFISQLIDNINKIKQILKYIFSLNSNIIKNHQISLEKIKNLKIYGMNYFDNIIFNQNTNKENSFNQISKNYQYSIRRLFDQNRTQSISTIASNYIKIKRQFKNNKSNIYLPKIVAIKKIL